MGFHVNSKRKKHDGFVLKAYNFFWSLVLCTGFGIAVLQHHLEKARHKLLDVVDIVEVLCQGITHVNGHHLPVRLSLKQKPAIKKVMKGTVPGTGKSLMSMNK